MPCASHALQDVTPLLILEAACDLSMHRRDVMRAIGRVAASAAPHAPIAVAAIDLDAPGEDGDVVFERADQRYAARFLDWQRSVSAAAREWILGLGPGVVDMQAAACEDWPVDYLDGARRLVSLCVMSNTDNRGGIHIMFGDPDMSDWPFARAQPLHDLAHHLAAVWQIRHALDGGDPAADGAPATARGALIRAVRAHDRERPEPRSEPRSTAGLALWPALVAGQWSLLDAFTADGARYLVAYRNPEAAGGLRALTDRERTVLDLALAGESGKWIAAELAVSESAVARALRAALRKLGVVDTAALAGVQTAAFEPLDGVNAGVALALARLAPGRSLTGLSGAERAIVTDLLDGKRVTAIARDRGTSPRTVAHQIASVYRKLGASSRRELLAMLG